MQYQEAQAIVNSWGAEGKVYKTEPDYQSLLRELTARFPYRLDTNFAKIDRIALGGLEAFKQNVMQTIFIDRSVHMWVDAINKSDISALITLIEPDTPSAIY